ncbi:unnamed protein product (macronuclear) [Paramecium tetraurelia]|uniref:Transmembrane protein n=1 Tax=Paramecium tetraurelia TaxID=5888 RepID=A0D3C0_PARTE|nr:uncharacterized protein GSPATT00013022001 [Paramecium tetraurelia]CAK77537.1 unnamed protein product [Paramecium tetraurelia]|eukprot:XP_001444934.1 hypothetical protein (macronuclear) [Paramecium tetraurelia strain d4-2]
MRYKGLQKMQTPMKLQFQSGIDFMLVQVLAHMYIFTCKCYRLQPSKAKVLQLQDIIKSILILVQTSNHNLQILVVINSVVILQSLSTLITPSEFNEMQSIIIFILYTTFIFHQNNQNIIQVFCIQLHSQLQTYQNIKFDDTEFNIDLLFLISCNNSQLLRYLKLLNQLTYQQQNLKFFISSNKLYY